MLPILTIQSSFATYGSFTLPTLGHTKCSMHPTKPALAETRLGPAHLMGIRDLQSKDVSLHMRIAPRMVE